MKSRTKSKKKKNIDEKGLSRPASIPYYLVLWNMIIVMLTYFSRLTSHSQIASSSQAIKSKSTKEKKIKKESKTDIVPAEKEIESKKIVKARHKMQVDERPEVAEQESVPRLLTFSVVPEDRTGRFFGSKAVESKATEKSAAQQAEPVESDAGKAKKSRSSSAKKFHLPLWTQLKIIVSNTRVNLIEALPDASKVSPLEMLIANLAFLYRYHLFNLALKVLIREGNDKYRLHMVRTDIVHKINSDFFNSSMIGKTQAALSQLDLSELNGLSSGKHKIDGFELTDSLLEMPLTIFLAQQDDKYLREYGKPAIEKWLKSTAIPLLATIAAHRDIHNKPSDCDDAMKMLIIIMGEYCPKIDDMEEKKFIPKNTGEFTDFLHDCRGMRNSYSHHALTEDQDNNLLAFVNAYKVINPVTFKDECPYFADMLVPSKKINLSQLQDRPLVNKSQ